MKNIEIIRGSYWASFKLLSPCPKNHLFSVERGVASLGKNSKLALHPLGQGFATTPNVDFTLMIPATIIKSSCRNTIM